MASEMGYGLAPKHEDLQCDESCKEYLSHLSYLQNLPIKKDDDPPLQGPIQCYCNPNGCLGMHSQENLECCCTPEKMDRMKEERDYLSTVNEYVSKLPYLQDLPAARPRFSKSDINSLRNRILRRIKFYFHPDLL